MQFLQRRHLLHEARTKNIIGLLDHQDVNQDIRIEKCAEPFEEELHSSLLPYDLYNHAA